MNLKPLYRVDLVEDKGQHFYCVDNDPTFLPGVTGILDCISKVALIPWAAKETALYMQKILLRVRWLREPEDRFFETLVKRAKKQPRFIKERAAEIGSHAHRCFDSVLKKDKEVYGTTPFMASFEHWLKTEKLTILKGDTRVASLEHGYGGSLDALAQDETGKLIVIDFKTGKSLYESHAFQVSAYSQAFKETYGLDYRPEGVIIRFEKDKPKYERRETRDINDSFAAFKAALDLSKALKLVHFQNRQTIKPMKIKEKENATTR